MNLKYLLILFLSLPVRGLAQEHPFNFKRVSIHELDSIELQFGSQKKTYGYKITVSDDYLPDLDVASLDDPVGYILKKLSDTPLEVQYFYSLPDSPLRFVEYSWDFKNKVKLIWLI